jgi:hypothetical protein
MTIEVSVKHDVSEAEDSEKVNVYQIDLATNTKVFDPKLSGAGEIESTINHTGIGYAGCNLFDIAIEERAMPFAINDKFEFRTEYDFNEYRSSLARPDWYLPGVKGRTPASTIITDTFSVE